MTIKWGDPIECNGVRPDWLRGDEQVWGSEDDGSDYGDCYPAYIDNVFSGPHFRLRADHQAYVALARGFTPWGGGESAPDDWDGGAVLVQDAFGEPSQSRFGPREISEPRIQNWSGVEGRARIIGYRKRNTRFDEPHLARIEVEGPAPVEGVFIKQMTEAEARDWIMNHTYTESTAHILHALGQLGLVETIAERFTRETGHAITEAVEAALNWKES